jgi:hypothetical protein
MVKVEIPAHLQGKEWERMPKPGRPGQPGGRLCGMCRTTLLELDQAGHIKTVSVRKPGKVKGLRLIYMPSLYAYLESLMEA